MRRYIWNILFWGLLIFVLMSLSRCKTPVDKQVESSETKDLIVEEEEVFIQGYSQKLYSIDSGIVQPNQSLGQILPNYGVNYTTIVTLSDSFKDIFDVKKILASKKN